MNKQILTLALALAVATTTASAAIEQHSVNYSYSLANDEWNLPRLQLPGFDDMGGQRVLTGATIRVQTTVSATLAVENMTAGPLLEWAVEGQHLVITSLERPNPADPESPNFGPFAFLGGLGIAPFSAPLQPNDGTPGSGTDRFTFSDSIDLDSTVELFPEEITFFLGGGEVTAVVGPFTEWLIDGATQYDPFSETGDLTVDFTALAQAGTYTVTYEYTAVPEPTGLAMAGAALLPCLTRRRR